MKYFLLNRNIMPVSLDLSKKNKVNFISGRTHCICLKFHDNYKITTNSKTCLHDWKENRIKMSQWKGLENDLLL